MISLYKVLLRDEQLRQPQKGKYIGIAKKYQNWAMRLDSCAAPLNTIKYNFPQGIREDWPYLIIRVSQRPPAKREGIKTF